MPDASLQNFPLKLPDDHRVTILNIPSDYLYRKATHTRRRITAGATAMLLVIQLYGCAALTTGNQDSAPTQGTLTDIATPQNATGHEVTEKGWWNVSFHRPFSPDDEVQWQYDTYIALKVIKPIIDSSKEITLWRFHRRAAADASGHTFSFIFYASRETGDAVYQHINRSAMVKELLNGSHIQRLSFYDSEKPLRPDLENTSDKNWPPELQKAWPYFIMGVSQTWLNLVEQYYAQLDLSGNESVERQLEGLKTVNSRLDVLWRNYGNHAFLHHLNALFAYQELYIIERKLHRF